MCLAEGQLNRPTPLTVQPDVKQKRRSIAGATAEQRKASRKELDKVVAMQDILDSDDPPDFVPLGFDEADPDDMHTGDDCNNTDVKGIAWSGFSPPAQFLGLDQFLHSEMCAPSHFADVNDNLADQDLGLLRDLGLLAPGGDTLVDADVD